MNESSHTTPPKQKGPVFSFTGVLVLVVLLAVLLAVLVSPPENGSDRGGLKVGAEAPEIKAAGWVNGLPPQDLSNKVVVVDAWATWCFPCKLEAPHLVEAFKQFENESDVVFIGLTSDTADREPEIQKFLDDVNITWPNGYGADETLLAFQAYQIPAAWVIDRDGKIVWNFASEQSLQEAIQNALKE